MANSLETRLMDYCQRCGRIISPAEPVYYASANWSNPDDDSVITFCSESCRDEYLAGE